MLDANAALGVYFNRHRHPPTLTPNVDRNGDYLLDFPRLLIGPALHLKEEAENIWDFTGSEIKLDSDISNKLHKIIMQKCGW